MSSMSDRILLQGIQFYGYTGSTKRNGGSASASSWMWKLHLDLTGAEDWDDVSLSVDYSQVHAAVLEIGTRQQSSC